MDWLNEAWRFIESEDNQKALAFIGAGIAVAGAAVWQVYTHFVSPGSTAEPARTVTADGGGFASGGDIHFTQSSPGPLIVGGVHGIRPEDFQRVSEELGVTKAALASFFKVLDKQEVAREDLDSTLRDFAKRYKQLEEDLKRYTSDDPEVAALREQARAALEAGEFDRAEQLLNEASAKDLAAAERQESVARQRRLSAAQSKANNGDLKRTQFAYREAAEYYRQAAALVPAEALVQRAEYLNLQGRALHEAGDYRDAEGPFMQALALREQALGPEHPDVATSLNNLAELYDTQGRYAKAEPLYQRSLAIREQALGLDHPDVGESLNNLAELYRAQAQYAKAEPLYQRSLGIREQALGSEHPEVAASLSNLAGLYHAQGQYAKAEPRFERALAILEKTLGPEHPDVAKNLNNLAEHYRVQGQYAKAEPLYQRAVTIDEEALGPEHPGLATDLNNLALLYHAQSQYAKAEPLYQRSLAIAQKALGPEHPTWRHSERTTAHRCAQRAARPRPTPSRRRLPRRRPSRVEIGGCIASPAFRKIAQEEAASEAPFVAVRWVLPIADRISVSEHRRVLYWIAHPLAPSRWEVE
ncbi:MAG: tetratricopeptide repeat protein [Actinomycetota bacterium]